MGVGIGAVVATLPAMAVGTFAIPGVAVAVNEDLDYWPGAGWSFLGALLGGGSGTLGVIFECPYPESLYLPATLSIGGSILTTTIWAFTTNGPDKQTDAPATEVGTIGLVPLGGDSISGASLTWSGTF